MKFKVLWLKDDVIVSYKLPKFILHHRICSLPRMANISNPLIVSYLSFLIVRLEYHY